MSIDEKELLINQEEYKLAAEKAEEIINKPGYLFLDDIEELSYDTCKNNFINKFGPEALQELIDSNKVLSIFYDSSNEEHPLYKCIARDNTYISLFGYIGNQTRPIDFGLNWDDGWKYNDNRNPISTDTNTAESYGKLILEALIEGANEIKICDCDTLKEYEDLNTKLKNILNIKSIPFDMSEKQWVHKYYSIIFDDKFSSFHNVKKNQEIYAKFLKEYFKIPLAKGYYARSGQFSVIQKMTKSKYYVLQRLYDREFDSKKDYDRRCNYLLNEEKYKNWLLSDAKKRLKEISVDDYLGVVNRNELFDQKNLNSLQSIIDRELKTNYKTYLNKYKEFLESKGILNYNDNSERTGKMIDYVEILEKSKNIILHGAPGTGKTYLAKKIAALLISNGLKHDEEDLDADEKKQIGFVQFHPSYDYTDFVEGLRPCKDGKGQIGFELKPGTFKSFVDNVIENNNAEEESDGYDPERGYSKKFVFIIDEINRGEISKIFGELFFSIDPDYRGPNGAVSTQYSNLHDDPNVKFYIPENVYIIGTMNDIDRSVDTFDFAMRRRFRFIEVKAEERANDILSNLKNDEIIDKAKKVMTALNKKIADTVDLGSKYEIGPAYYLRLSDVNNDFSVLWSDYIEPLLLDYVQGMDDPDIIQKCKIAYESINITQDSDQVENDGSGQD